RLLRFGLLVAVRLRAGVRVTAAGAIFALLPARATPVIRRVEAGALEVDGDRVENALDRLRTTDLALLGRGFADPLEQLENVSVRTTVLVDRHFLTVAAGVANSGCFPAPARPARGSTAHLRTRRARL